MGLLAVPLTLWKPVGRPPHLDTHEMFLANYPDGLTDLPLDEHTEAARRHGKIATFLAGRRTVGYYFVTSDETGVVTSTKNIDQSGLPVNEGYSCSGRMCSIT